MVETRESPPLFTASIEQDKKALYEPIKIIKPVPIRPIFKTCINEKTAETRMVIKHEKRISSGLASFGSLKLTH
jgi:hypothetical protein